LRTDAPMVMRRQSAAVPHSNDHFSGPDKAIGRMCVCPDEQ